MIERGRLTAAHQDGIVLFVIGMRINRVMAVHQWWPVFRAMSAMLREVSANRASGFLGVEPLFRSWRMPVTLQYWRSFEQLHAYAHDPLRAHSPAWRAFNKAVGGDGTVGIFHETYVVPAGASETIYADMVPFGFGKASGRVAASGSRKDARSRLSAG